MLAMSTHNFHVPLPKKLYARLRTEAASVERPATELARHAIECWLDQQERAALNKAISAYATQWAGTDVDLDQDLEAAGVSLLAEEE